MEGELKCALSRLDSSGAQGTGSALRGSNVGDENPNREIVVRSPFIVTPRARQCTSLASVSLKVRDKLENGGNNSSFYQPHRQLVRSRILASFNVLADCAV